MRCERAIVYSSSACLIQCRVHGKSSVHGKRSVHGKMRFRIKTTRWLCWKIAAARAAANKGSIFEQPHRAPICANQTCCSPYKCAVAACCDSNSSTAGRCGHCWSLPTAAPAAPRPAGRRPQRSRPPAGEPPRPQGAAAGGRAQEEGGTQLSSGSKVACADAQHDHLPLPSYPWQAPCKPAHASKQSSKRSAPLWMQLGLAWVWAFL